MIAHPTPSTRARHLVILAAIVHALTAFWYSGTALAQSGPLTIVAYGDSLTAGYGLPPKAAFPVQLEAALKAKGHDVEIVNAGVSGDTTAAALERFDWAIPDTARAAIVELGANDALRGQDPGAAKRNLSTIITKLKARGMVVLLAGMMAPRNWGADYARQFDGMYRELADQHGVALYPFFLDGVALKPELTMPDGLHPTQAGIAEIVRRILPAVEDLIAKAKSTAGTGKT